MSRLYGAVMGAQRLLGCRCHSPVRFGATRTGRFEHGGQGGGTERAVTSLICASRASGSARRVVGRRRGLATFCAGLSASLISPSPTARLYGAAQRGHRVLLRAAPAVGVAAGRDVGLDVGDTRSAAPLVMALTRRVHELASLTATS